MGRKVRSRVAEVRRHTSVMGDSRKDTTLRGGPGCATHQPTYYADMLRPTLTAWMALVAGLGTATCTPPRNEAAKSRSDASAATGRADSAKSRSDSGAAALEPGQPSSQAA